MVYTGVFQPYILPRKDAREAAREKESCMEYFNFVNSVFGNIRSIDGGLTPANLEAATIVDVERIALALHHLGTLCDAEVRRRLYPAPVENYHD